mmetsp:Transcript_14016/g.35385  ORF Transcript_14016/g.35385 Transcript_14016/m.35385 type:complete len:207 (+) Transcript_14016:493-1113(+)
MAPRTATSAASRVKQPSRWSTTRGYTTSDWPQGARPPPRFLHSTQGFGGTIHGCQAWQPLSMPRLLLSPPTTSLRRTMILAHWRRALPPLVSPGHGAPSQIPLPHSCVVRARQSLGGISLTTATGSASPRSRRPHPTSQRSPVRVCVCFLTMASHDCYLSLPPRLHYLSGFINFLCSQLRMQTSSSTTSQFCFMNASCHQHALIAA